MARVARRMLAANVTASLGVDLPPDASEAEVAAAVEVQRLSADAPIAMLSSDPDRFFGRTTKALDVTVARVGAATGETGPGLRGVCLGGGGGQKTGCSSGVGTDWMDAHTLMTALPCPRS